MRSRAPRGFTFISFLFLVGLAAGIWWLISFGPAYWDNISIKGECHEAANYGMKTTNPEDVRKFLIKKLQAYERLEVAPDDVRIDLQPFKFITIDLTYTRTVRPLLTGERQVVFTRHVEQDLTPVKW
jgi:hypothetical protein